MSHGRRGGDRRSVGGGGSEHLGAWGGDLKRFRRCGRGGRGRRGGAGREHDGDPPDAIAGNCCEDDEKQDEAAARDRVRSFKHDGGL